jgi:hypothetical protein
MLRRGPWAGHVARKEECYMHIKLGCNAWREKKTQKALA